MSWGDWIGLLAALGTWSGIIIAIVTFLHGKRQQAQTARDQDVNRRFDALTASVIANQRRAEEDHRALGTQVADIAATVARHYMPRADVEGALHRIDENIGNLRGEVGNGLAALQARVDRLFDRRLRNEPE